MKPEAGNDKLKMAQQQKTASTMKASGRASPVAASGNVVQLGRLSHAELMSLAQRHNKQLGLLGDVLAPVMRGVADAATVRPPAVHPFTVGGAPRKDEYQAAWKSLSKRVGMPLLAPSEAPTAAAAGSAGRAGRLASGASGVAVAVTASEAVPQPTHAQMYGSAEQPLQQVQFAETLASWLGVGPIDLPLLAPGAPPLPLRRLFMEVLEAGGTGDTNANGGGGGGEPLSWAALAGKLQGDEKLGDLVRQVYDAYLLPLERRLPRGTRPARVEAWMQEDLRRRGLLGELMMPSAEQVASRSKAARAAILALQQQQQALQRGSDLPMDIAGAVERTGPEAGGAEGIASRASAAAQPPLPPSQVSVSLAAEAMQALRVAAVAAPTLLPGIVLIAGSSKRARASSRGSRRGSKVGSSRKRARSSNAAGAGGGPEGAAAGRDGSVGAEGVAGTGTVLAATAAASAAADAMGAGDGGCGGTSAVSSLTDPKASALLSVVASLRELRAGPPGCATRPPDLRANFMARWEELHAERAAAAAVAAAAAAAAASVPAGAGAAASMARAAGARDRVEAPRAAGAGAAIGTASAQPGEAEQQQQEEKGRMEVDGVGSVEAVVQAHAKGDGRGRKRATAAADGGSTDQPVGQKQPQRGSRQAKRQSKLHAGEAAAQPPPQQSGSRKSDSPRKSSQQPSSPRGQGSRGQKQHGREPPRPPQPPQPQRERDRERDLPRNRPGDDWRRPSPYGPPQLPPLHYQAHRGSQSSAVPLMSTAASPHDSRAAVPPQQLPLRSAHRPLPSPPVPPAVQQHLEEMRRHAHARISYPYSGGDGGSGGDYYDYDNWHPPTAERGERENGSGGAFGPGGPGRSYPYARHPAGGGERRGGGWDEGSGRGGDRGWEYDYGPPRGPH